MKRSNRAWGGYFALTQQLAKIYPQAQILIVGGPDEAELGQQLCIEPQVKSYCGHLSIAQTALLLQSCSLAIAGDTGPLHLAASVGCPVIGIYGPTALSRTGPRTRMNHRVLTPPEQLDCWPCEEAECPMNGDDYLACMNDITVEQVLSTVSELLSSVPVAAR
jgi:ADP-heptose:LPS heptosyltransferase